jgi:hypothetical protein
MTRYRTVPPFTSYTTPTWTIPSTVLEATTVTGPLRGLKNYSFRVETELPFQSDPSDITRNDHNLFLGVELEVQAKPTTSSSIPEHMTMGREGSLKDFCFCKHDATTGSRGFEITSAPATYKVHRKKWDEFFNKDACLLQSENQHNCGMHVHASRRYFTPLEIGKLLLMYNNPNNMDFIQDISGRQFSGYFMPKPDHQVTDMILKGSTGGNERRNSSVNTHPNDTIEFRCFNGTVNRGLFFSRLGFTHAVCQYVLQAGVKRLDPLNFINWLLSSEEHYANYYELIMWLWWKGYTDLSGVSISKVENLAEYFTET